jgi:hypothetical protein
MSKIIQVIKDASGNVRGRIIDDGSKLHIENKHLKRIGQYDKHTDVTVDYHLKPIGRGNLLTTLL